MVALPATAQADETPQAKSTEGYVTASVTPASQSATEILGITNVDELQLPHAKISLDDQQNCLKYIFMGTDEWNENPNPYFYNTVYKIDGAQWVVDNSGKRRNNAKAPANPIRALAPYTTDTGSEDYDASDNEVWEQLPDLIVGDTIADGTRVNYDSDEYARAVETGLGRAANSYHPTSVTYTMSDLSAIAAEVYNIAEAGDKLAASTGKKLRYDSAMDIAKNFEKYQKGIQGYILKCLEVNKAEKKTVAVVSAINDDAITLVRTPQSWSTGTRFLEITSYVADNYADTLADNGDSVTITRDELSKAPVDLIILMDDSGANVAAGNASSMGSLATKCYWAVNQDAGAIYKTNANAPEIATNYGRILGCLYPEYVDQSDLVAYYYDTFYHIKDGKIAAAVDYGMDGVRNWDVQTGSGNALLQWGADTAADYNQAEVQNILNEGTAYLKEMGEEAPDRLVVSKNLTSADLKYTQTAKADISKASVTLSITSAKYTGSQIKPTVTVKVGSDKLASGTDYAVSYKNNTNIGTATVTVTGKGNYTGKVSKTFKIVVSKGSAYTVGAFKYKIADAATNGKGTVAVSGAAKSASKQTGALAVPSTVKIGGKTFKVTSVASNAFKGYKKITKVTVGNNVKTIGTSAFQGCTALKSVTLGSAVTSIGKQAFYGDKKLSTITVNSKSLKSVGKNAVKGTYAKAKVKVPSSKVSAYKKLFTTSTGFAKTMTVVKK